MELVKAMENPLSHPKIFNLFLSVVGGGSRSFTTLVREYIRPDNYMSILDLCCGTSNILPYLEYSEYIGIDLNVKNTEHCRKKYADKRNVHFINGDINPFLRSNEKQFDIILFLSGMHHFCDADLISCLRNVQRVLKPEGRLITIDGCLESDLPLIAKLMLKNDRGKYVRIKDAWIEIVSSVMPDIKFSIRRDLNKIPYNHIIFYT